MLKKALGLSAAAVMAVTGIAATAKAQPTSGAGTGVGDVVITARKRSENLQKVPVAVTSVSGQQLQQQGLRTLGDINRAVPSLSVTVGGSTNTAANFNIRGQQPVDTLITFFPAVGLYEDSGNIPHPVGTAGAFFDIQRLEVLKGPQGTLYGRNTTGGAVNIITRGADYNGIHGYIYGEAGNFADKKVQAAVNVPIIQDVLSMRLAGSWWRRDGFAKSTLTGEDLGDDHNDKLGRLSIRFDPTSNFTSTTKVEYGRYDLHGTFTKFAGTGVLPDPSTVSPNLFAALSAGPVGLGLANLESLLETGQPLDSFANDHIYENAANENIRDRVRTWHAVEDASWDITDELKLRSVTSYHKVTDFQVEEIDSSPVQINVINAGNGGAVPLTQPPGLPLPFDEPPSQAYEAYSQEFDLSGHSFGRLDWLVGAFGSTEKGTGSEFNVVFPVVSALGGAASVHNTSAVERSTSWAFYTQNDLHLSDRVSITLGARYTSETQKASGKSVGFDPITQLFQCAADATPIEAADTCPLLTQSEKASGTSYLASFNYQITPQTLFYVKTARGFKGGGNQFRAPGLPPFQPETATDYEIGLKSDFFDHHLRTNLAAYHTNYANKQGTEIILINGRPSTLVQNVAKATIDGFEAEFSANPLRGWSVYGNLTYIKGVNQDFPNPLTASGQLLFIDNPNCATETQPGVFSPTADAAQHPDCIAHNIPFADPHWRYSIGSRYEFDVGPGKLGGQLDWSWVGKANTSILSRDVTVPASLDDLFNHPKSLGILNGRLDYTLPDHQLTVALFATNLLDKQQLSPGLNPSILGFATESANEPRMWGVSLRKAFGDE